MQCKFDDGSSDKKKAKNQPSSHFDLSFTSNSFFNSYDNSNELLADTKDNNACKLLKQPTL